MWRSSVCNYNLMIVIGVLLVVSMLVLAPSFAQTSCPPPDCDEDSLKTVWEISPYFWAPGINGDVEIRGVHLPVDVSFSDISDEIDNGFMLHGNVRNPASHWGTLFDFMYVSLDGSRGFAGPGVTVGTDLQVTVGELAAMYSPRTDLELRDAVEAGESPIPYSWILGARFFWTDTSLDVSPGTSGSHDQSWAEPMIGVVTKFPVSGKLSAALRGDIGGFSVGESKFTSNFVIDMRYQFSRAWWANLGYKWFSLDTLDDGEGIDVTFAGPIIGVTGAF